MADGRQQGIAATSQPLASAAAAQILARGGSAADAAIAANAVLAVEIADPVQRHLVLPLAVLVKNARSHLNKSNVSRLKRSHATRVGVG